MLLARQQSKERQRGNPSQPFFIKPVEFRPFELLGSVENWFLSGFQAEIAPANLPLRICPKNLPLVVQHNVRI